MSLCSRSKILAKRICGSPGMAATIRFVSSSTSYPLAVGTVRQMRASFVMGVWSACALLLDLRSCFPIAFGRSQNIRVLFELASASVPMSILLCRSRISFIGANPCSRNVAPLTCNETPAAHLPRRAFAHLPILCRRMETPRVIRSPLTFSNAAAGRSSEQFVISAFGFRQSCRGILVLRATR